MTLSDLNKTEVLDATDIGHKVKRLALEILEDHPDGKPLALVGIETRGVPLARRAAAILEAEGELDEIHFGSLDISLYRDDLDNLGTIPSIKGSDLPFTVDGCHVVLFDDVLFTGRTIRAAIDALVDYGRPARIDLAVLVDRGNRELPIAATYVGHVLETTPADYVRVLLEDGTSALYLHLRKDGALVNLGERVERGQEIARSGNTGWSAMPHLHFQLDRRDTHGRWRSIPVRFAEVRSGCPRMLRAYVSGNRRQERCSEPVR